MKRQYRYYDFVMAAYVCIVLCANLIGASKETHVFVPFWGDRPFLAGVLFFPLSYIFGDILTEVYGYALDRRVVWAGSAALVFAAFMAWVIVALPPSRDFAVNQPHLEFIFGATPRIVAGSIIAFWSGSFVNSYVLARMKIMTSGRWLWTRTIGSTLFGEAVDTLIFYAIAFAGVWASGHFWNVVLDQYILKCGWEILATPVTYKVVAFLKRAEQEDYYDRKTNFTPFSLKS